MREMEVVLVPEFHFDFHRHHNRHYTSAPTSPTAACRGIHSSSVPFDWEEKPGTPKSNRSSADFDFDFNGWPAPTPASLIDADELFELGIIRPLKPPPRLYVPVTGEQSPKSPGSRGRLFSSPRRRSRGKELDPFALAMVEATRDGGERKKFSSARNRKGSGSLSPFRGRGEVVFHTPVSSPPPPPHAGNGGSRSWKWRFKDLLLLRSSIRDGRSKDHLCKYTSSSPSSSLSPKARKGFVGGEESRSSSFRSVERGPSMRRGSVTPHEMHFAEKRVTATAAEKKKEKKSAVPYQQSFFSCLGFSPAVRSLTAGGSFSRVDSPQWR